MALVSKSELRSMLHRSVPRLADKDRPGEATDEVVKRKQTLREQAAENLRKLGM